VEKQERAAPVGMTPVKAGQKVKRAGGTPFASFGQGLRRSGQAGVTEWQVRRYLLLSLFEGLPFAQWNIWEQADSLDKN
jgi:hypothetical protein